MGDIHCFMLWAAYTPKTKGRPAKAHRGLIEEVSEPSLVCCDFAEPGENSKNGPEVCCDPKIGEKCQKIAPF